MVLANIYGAVGSGFEKCTTGIELQKQKPVEMWVFTVEMDAAVSDETNLRF